MSYNLLIWRWNDAYADKNRRRREGLKHGSVAAGFMHDGDHPALGEFEQEAFLAEVQALFPSAGEPDGPFVVEQYPKGVVFNYGAEERFRIVPILGGLAAKRGLNSTEA
jgi:hypothetical protein